MCISKLILVFGVYVTCTLHKCSGQDSDLLDLANMVKLWADNLGRQLHTIAESVTRRTKVIDSFKQTKIFCEGGNKTAEEIADKLRVMMAEKEKAVKKIVERAEFLSFYRKEPIFENSTYDYYNADNITNTTSYPEIDQRLYEDMIEREKQFACELEMNNRMITKDSEKVKRAYSSTASSKVHSAVADNQSCQIRPYIEYEPDYHRNLPLVHHPHFDADVNLNFSSVRVSTSIYDREEPVLNDVRWSDDLDLVFKENYRDDPTLIWQYFAGASGFLRHYPAVQWSQEKYDRTFEFRTRAWFLESISSPKDVIILMDMTGSMWQENWILSKALVNNILDTLGDNDYVNIYLFNDETHPLVDCFNYTLMQAHEENLRLLRESLNKHEPYSHGNMKKAFRMAFATLEKYRNFDGKAHCNQIIMFISEGIDYDYDPADLFSTYAREDPYYTSVRVFTFLIGTLPSDEVQMSWIACANMGYYVNISEPLEIPEKVLKYLTVLSRPLNMNNEKPEPIWTGAYADLADRRLTNWLWNKHEGNVQRDILIEYTREAYKKYNCIFDENMENDHFLLKTDHDYARYRTQVNFKYMTTVSLPAYDLRPGETHVLGVAAVDVPITFIKKLTMPHRIGVNGYAFILTNNGLLLLHPDHRKEFENNLKPTFNRVDLTEAELVDDLNEPRNFNKEMLEMREQIVNQKTGSAVFNIKTPIDNRKRILLLRRHYFYTKIGPFSLVVVIPHEYGFCSVRYDVKPSIQNPKLLSGLRNTRNWKIHPEWLYCKHYGTRRIHFDTPEEELMHFLEEIQQRDWTWHKYCYPLLVNTLILDAKSTEWFEDRFAKWTELVNRYQIILAFLATHTGLTRWRSGIDDAVEPYFVRENNKSIDEIWYKRSVEHNYHGNPKSFLYSVPFNPEPNNKTLVTATNAIIRDTSSRRVPVAVVGFQFSHFVLESMFRKTTSECGSKTCRHTCDSKELTCFVLDNNAYVVVSDEGHTGEFLGDIRPDIMKHMVENGVYRQTRFVDYQDICYLDPPKPKPKTKSKAKSPASRRTTFFSNIYGILQWMFTTIICFAKSIMGAVHKDNACLRAITSEYNKLAIRKTLPTPCDQERYLYTLQRDTFTGTNENMFTIPECLWPYIVHPIPDTNLILMVVNAPCNADTIESYPFTPEPKEIKYNLSMPCYIATKNNYTRRQYISCINKNDQESTLNHKSKKYCGITW